MNLMYEKYFNLKKEEVLLVPDLWIILFSITQATSKPSTKVIWEDNLITVKSDENEIHLNKCLSHGKGKVLAADFNPIRKIMTQKLLILLQAKWIILIYTTFLVMQIKR
jgi:hypothetical protein